MAKIKWSAFPAGTTIDGADSVVGLQSGVNVIWTWGQVLTYIAGGGATFLAGDGSASAPSYSFASDTNTGFYHAFGDQIEVSVGGARRFTFDTAEFGIGGLNLALFDIGFTNAVLLRQGGAAASLQLGAADAASPVAQTLQVQSVVAGTSNTAGADWTFRGSLGTGNQPGGSIYFRPGEAGSSGTQQNPVGNSYVRITPASNGVITLTLQDSITGQASISSNGGITGISSVVSIATNSATPGVFIGSSYAFGISATGGYVTGADTLLTRAAAASWQLGYNDADTNAAIVAQTIRSQGVTTGGTNNQAGKNWTFIASPGKGTGAGGSFIFQTAPAGGSGNTLNAPVTALTINSAGQMLAADGSAAAPAYAFSSHADMGLFTQFSLLKFATGGSEALAIGGGVAYFTSIINSNAATATPAHGSTSAVLLFGTTAGFGIYYGSNTPTISAAQGSLYLRSDGTGVADRAYINTNGSTTWAAIATAA